MLAIVFYVQRAIANLIASTILSPTNRNRSLHDRSLYRLGVLERKLPSSMFYHLFVLLLFRKLGSDSFHKRIEFGLQLSLVPSLQK